MLRPAHGPGARVYKEWDCIFGKEFQREITRNVRMIVDERNGSWGMEHKRSKSSIFMDDEWSAEI